MVIEAPRFPTVVLIPLLLTFIWTPEATWILLLNDNAIVTYLTNTHIDLVALIRQYSVEIILAECKNVAEYSYRQPPRSIFSVDLARTINEMILVGQPIIKGITRHRRTNGRSQQNQVTVLVLPHDLIDFFIDY